MGFVISLDPTRSVSALGDLEKCFLVCVLAVPLGAKLLPINTPDLNISGVRGSQKAARFPVRNEPVDAAVRG